jgi:hypothetical protein
MTAELPDITLRGGEKFLDVVGGTVKDLSHVFDG